MPNDSFKHSNLHQDSLDFLNPDKSNAKFIIKILQSYEARYHRYLYKVMLMDIGIHEDKELIATHIKTKAYEVYNKAVRAIDRLMFDILVENTSSVEPHTLFVSRNHKTWKEF